MLVPRNPRDDDPIWAALASSLRGAGDFHVVRDGAAVVAPAVAWTEESAARLVQALKAKTLRFVGARHGQPLAPHFAVAERDVTSGVLVELVCMRFRGDGDAPAGRDLLHDLGVVAACVSSSRPAWSTLVTPLGAPAGIEALPEGISVVDGVLVLDLRSF